MKRILIFLCSLLLVTIVACKHNELTNPFSGGNDVLKQKQNTVEVPVGDPFAKEDIDNLVIKFLYEKNDFKWEWVDIKTLWSALQEGEHTVAIGYKPYSIGDVNAIIHTINIKSTEWKNVHDAIIKLVLDGLNKNGASVTAKDIIVEDDQVLPIITFHLTDKDVLTALCNLENIRYIEPLDYWPYQIERSASGCSASTTALDVTDYSTTTPACIVPWNYNSVNIPTAWNTAQGEGITIGVIDAGISSTQPLLGAQFTNGYSNNNRTVTTGYTYGTSAYTSCTHGTSMCGLATGPRNDQNAVTGVAYKSSLYFVRACYDVVLDESAEKLGVKNALVLMGNRPDVKIVSMSVGYPFSSSVLYDGVTYAYNNGKMLFAAAGTSYSWTSWWGVIYPANYSQCNAITGVKENNVTCTVCHDGSQVDFTIPMERNSNSNRNSLSLPFSGITPTYIGGSSCATATAAGIAALVWSAKPSITREQVFNCLKSTAQFANNPNSSTGYGNLNASGAVNMALTQ